MGKCSKRKFTKKEAEGALNQIEHHRKQHKYRKECRIYHCPECNKWHLTSHENEPPSPKIKPLPGFKKYLK